jgi:hypothetical protein
VEPGDVRGRVVDAVVVRLRVRPPIRNGDEPVPARVPQPRADSAEQVAGGSILERLGGLLRKIPARRIERVRVNIERQIRRRVKAANEIAGACTEPRQYAGSGGVGTFAIQLAKHLGATVATTTSSANRDLVRSLGADVVIDYKTQEFEHFLSDYDVVLNSLGKDTLEKSLTVLKPGGQLISISGPPDVEFAREQGSNWSLQQLMRLMSFNIRRKARRHHVHYSFVYMRANGEQLSQITSLIESAVIRPVMDRIYPFDATKEALAYLDTGRARGKVVVKVR